MRFLALLILLIGCSSSPEVEKTQETASKKETPKIDRTAISQTIQKHRKYMSHCYGKTMTKKGYARIKGLTYVEFSIGPDGRAKNPKMVPEKSTLKNPALNECLFEGITSWDFPVDPSGQEITVIYPFRFNAQPPRNMQKKLDMFENLRSRH